MVYAKPYIAIFGGNMGNKINNDIWIINIDEPRLEWKKLEPTSELPPPRMYHTAAVCKYGGAAGMIVIFGGRSDGSSALNDTWGLRKHRNGSWDWVNAPYRNNVVPLRRFQHTMAFFNNLMILLGGRGDENLKTIPIEVYDTESSEWNKLASFDKFRHASWIVDNYLFTHGGFDYSNPQISNNSLVMIDIIKLIETSPSLSQKMDKFMDTKKQSPVNSKPNTPNLSPSHTNKGADITMSNAIHSNNSNNYSMITSNSRLPKSKQSAGINNIYRQEPLIMADAEISILTSDNNTNDEKLTIKRVNLDKIMEEKFKNKPINKEIESEALYEQFIKALLVPSEWRKNRDNEMTKFKFRPEHIIALTRSCQEIVASQPMVLRINTPVKVFGDIHGQYQDLMRFFEMWGEPKEGLGGDIAAIDYLFLGDYVDRGTLSLETICLLMALKIKYPDRFHLIRGNHEDKLINSNFGFLEECQMRLGDDPLSEESVFNIINEFFEFLPLAAIIEDQIICIHGGIGANLSYIHEIEAIERPLDVVHEATNKTQQIVMDILWSDPTDNDDEIGIQPNLLRDSNNYGNIVKYGPDIVKKFLHQNNLNMIIRAHECVLDGFERFASGSLITLFSATDYCRRHNNAGAMLIIKNNFEIVPHLIYPLDSGCNNWIDDDKSIKKRPPTPPRVRNQKNY
jgi:diadenosine tetraphosphatase ApaH/serine/threonine PP2A family protein phosphatase